MNKGFVFIRRILYQIQKPLRVFIGHPLQFPDRQAAQLRDFRSDFDNGRTIRGVSIRPIRFDEKPIGRNFPHEFTIIHRMAVQHRRPDGNVASDRHDIRDEAIAAGEAMEEKGRDEG